MSEEKLAQKPEGNTDAGNKKSSIVAEFKEFISKGNVIDLAVGIIIGTAFTAIVDSLVNNIIMPLIGMFVGGNRFNGLVLEIPWGDKPVIAYGSFIQAIINFLIIAACVFLIVKFVNLIVRKKPAPPKKPSNEEIYLQK